MFIEIEDDFDLGRIADSGQCFRWEQQQDGGYRIIHAECCLYIRRTGVNQFLLDCDEMEYESVWKPYFDLQTDYAAIRGRIDAGKDPFLYGAAEAEKGIRILRQDPWEMIVSFLISQNRNIPLIRQSIEALCEVCGELRKDRLGRHYRLFPAPEAVCALSEETLRGPCKLGYRWRYVQAVSRQAADGLLAPDALAKLPDAAMKRELLSVLGIGEKVAACIMLFGFHRLDTFPVDVWMKRVLQNEYPDGYNLSQNAPYNGVYQQYMFAYYRHNEDAEKQKPKSGK